MKIAKAGAASFKLESIHEFGSADYIALALLRMASMCC